MNFLHFTTNLLPIVTMIVLEPIGFVHNTCTTSQAPEFIKKEISGNLRFPCGNMGQDLIK